MNCRFCEKKDIIRFLDLGEMPLANSFLSQKELHTFDEKKFPLDVYFCDKCSLVQIGYIVPPTTLFTNYIYFSSTSDLIKKHAEYLSKHFKAKFELTDKHFVVEIASNDGTVLQFFKNTGIRVLGVEPASNVAKVAVDSGIDTVNVFFNSEQAKSIKNSHGKADIILARHVFAHVPEIHDFISGLSYLLSSKGAIAIEVPYIVDLIEKNEFDTIYHEHYSYLSFKAISSVFNRHNMEVFDVERVNIHGGSIIFYISHREAHPVRSSVHKLAHLESVKEIDSIDSYIRFSNKTSEIKNKLAKLIKKLKYENKRIAAYGAPAKGNTLLNYCGLSTNLIEYTVDKSPYKQGLYTPGTHIPIYHPDKLCQDMPDYALLLSWNFSEEILTQQKKYRNKGGKFIIPIPEVTVI